MSGILFVTRDIYSDLHSALIVVFLVVLVINRTISPYVVVVILNAPSWLSGVLCYSGYEPACAQQAPLWGGAFKAGLQAAERKKEGSRSCIIQIFWSFFSS